MRVGRGLPNRRCGVSSGPYGTRRRRTGLYGACHRKRQNPGWAFRSSRWRWTRRATPVLSDEDDSDGTTDTGVGLQDLGHGLRGRGRRPEVRRRTRCRRSGAVGLRRLERPHGRDPQAGHGRGRRRRGGGRRADRHACGTVAGHAGSAAAVANQIHADGTARRSAAAWRPPPSSCMSRLRAVSSAALGGEGLAGSGRCHGSPA